MIKQENDEEEEREEQENNRLSVLSYFKLLS